MAKQKIKPRGLKKLNLGGGESAKADYDSMIDDGYHAMDDEGMAKKAKNNLKGTGLNPPSPGDVQNALRKKVGEDEYEGKPGPIKFVSPGMTPEATGSGFKMNIGSKENFSESNFSSKDQSTISSAPSIMKNDFGGETIEMKDQGSPLNYGVRDNVEKERKMTDAENEAMGMKANQETQRQYLKDGMAVAQTVGNIASSFAKPA